jgi:hypothetical protein
MVRYSSWLQGQQGQVEAAHGLASLSTGCPSLFVGPDVAAAALPPRPQSSPFRSRKVRLGSTCCPPPHPLGHPSAGASIRPRARAAAAQGHSGLDAAHQPANACRRCAPHVGRGARRAARRRQSARPRSRRPRRRASSLPTPASTSSESPRPLPRSWRRPAACSSRWAPPPPPHTYRKAWRCRPPRPGGAAP